MRIRDLLGLDEIALSVFVPGEGALDREVSSILQLDEFVIGSAIDPGALALVSGSVAPDALGAAGLLGLVVVRAQDEPIDGRVMTAARRAGIALGSVPDSASLLAASRIAGRLLRAAAEQDLQRAVVTAQTLAEAQRSGGYGAALTAALDPCGVVGWLVDEAGTLRAVVGDPPTFDFVGEVWNSDSSRALDAAGNVWSVRLLGRARLAVTAGCPPPVLDALAEVLRADLRLEAERHNDAAALVGVLARGARDGDMTVTEIAVRLKMAGRDPATPTTVVIGSVDDPSFPVAAVVAATVDVVAAEGAVVTGQLDRSAVVLADAIKAQEVSTARPASPVPARWLPLLAGRRLRIGVADAIDQPSALGSAVLAAGMRPSAASARDTIVVAAAPGKAAHGDLLARLPGAVRAAFADQLIGPLTEYDERTGSDLVRTLRAFLDNNGAWVDTARMLDLHPNTMRYRMNRVEEITGRDLTRMADRVDLFLALVCRDGG
jgi:hypothetical protein